MSKKISYQKKNTQKKNSEINGTFLRLMEVINENKYRTYIFILLLTYKSFCYNKKNKVLKYCLRVYRILVIEICLKELTIKTFAQETTCNHK